MGDVVDMPDYKDRVEARARQIERSTRTQSVLNEVFSERFRQDAMWGEQNHSPTEWASILGEEVGEVSRAINEITFNHPGYREKARQDYRRELVEVAAVAVAMVESLDRNRK